VSSHSWGVALIVTYIHPECSARLLKAALWHDIPEYITGDIAAPTKWEHASLALEVERIETNVIRALNIDVSLMHFEQEVLKVADMADLILCCLEEYKLGNKDALVIVNRGMRYLNDMEPEFDKAGNFIAKLDGYVAGVQ